MTNNKWMVIVDGQPGAVYDDIGEETPLFSPDGVHIIYTAKRSGQWFVVVNGKEGPAYDEILGRPAFHSNRLQYLAVRANILLRCNQK